MSRRLAPRNRALAHALLESDSLYFEAGARTVAVGPGEIARLPGFETVAAGCVVHRIHPERLAAGAAAEWIAQVERHLQAMGCPLSRWYLVGPAPELARALARAGYQRRIELAFLLDAEVIPSKVRSLSLRAVETERQWAAKLALHRRVAQGPDGHATPARLWVELERRKAAAGYMRPYLVEIAGRVCGAVSAARSGRLLRMKNIVVDPAYRRRGVGTAVASAFGTLAAAMGCEAAGCFGIQDEAGARIYRLAGYRVVTRQTEWVKPFERER